VVGVLGYSSLQRQVRLSLLPHEQQVPGHTGMTAPPTAAVVLALLAQVALGQLRLGAQEGEQLSGVQPHHLLVCDALGLEHSWYAMSSAHQIDQCSQRP
jgi:hypothetical protein